MNTTPETDIATLKAEYHSIETRVDRLLDRLDEHVKECSKASQEIVKELQSMKSAMAERDEHEKMGREVYDLRHQVRANSDELKRLAEWRKWLTQRVLWWGIPILLTALASSAGLHLVG